MAKYCYYCLSTKINPIHKTGDGYFICPKCGIDSIDDFDDWQTLYIKHMESFHMDYDFNKSTTILLSCSNPKCKEWNILYKKIVSKGKI